MINKNGRLGKLESWDKKAIRKVRYCYYLYSQFKDKIHLEQEDKNYLLKCYKGHDKKAQHNKNKLLKEFITRQFNLMGYPKGKYLYIEMINGNMVLDFGLNEDRINKTLFNKYHGKKRDVRLNDKNEAHNNPTINEKGEGNNKPLTEKVNKEDEKEERKVRRIREKYNNFVDVTSPYIKKENDKRNEDLKGGWIEDGEVI